MDAVINQAFGDDWALYNGDCVEVVKGIPSGSVDLSVFSPPFSSVYTYSDSERDMGNCASDDEFADHYRFLARELLRITRPGRLCAVHCKDLVDYKGTSGRAGLRDFPALIRRVHEEEGWKYHSKVTIWKDPVIEMQRTKAHGLLYKQLRADSTFSRQGMAEYVVILRKWPTGPDEESQVVPVTHTKSSFPLSQWQEWASPVWMTINQTKVLNVQQAREDRDEKHMCPLQLDVIERLVRLYSNAGETVFSPFAGIGSEGHGALNAGRKFVGIELKPAYWRVGCANLGNARRQMGLFDDGSGVGYA